MFEDKAFEKEVFHFVRTNFPNQKIKKEMIKDIIYQIEMLCFRQEDRERDDIISFKDKMLDLNNFETIPTRKDIFTIFHIPYCYDSINMETPNFNRFIESSLVRRTLDLEGYLPDKDLISLVQEMFGFFLLGGLNGYKAWFLIGDGSNGKGVMSRILGNIFSKEYVQSMTIQAITADKYNAQELIGKKINISNEDESKLISSDRFKGIISGDPLHTSVKFKKGFSFVPRTKFIFCSNRMPTFQELDYGVKRRLMFIPFLRKFKEGDADRDINIDEKIKAEIPGIIRWALEGAKRLVKNEFVYTDCELSNSMMKEFEEDILSALQFVRENYYVDDQSIVSKKELYARYRIHCDSIGKKPYNYNNFKKQLTANVEGLKERKTTVDYKYVDGYNLVERTVYERGMDEVRKSFNQTENPKISLRPEPMQTDIQFENNGSERESGAGQETS